MQKFKRKIIAAIALIAIIMTVSSAFTVLFASADTPRYNDNLTNSYNIENTVITSKTGTIVPRDFGDLLQYEWPSSGQNSARTRFSAGPGPDTPSIAWQIPAGGSGTVTTWKGVAYYYQMFQTLSNSPLEPNATGQYPRAGGTVFAVNALTGAPIWSNSQPLPTYIFYPTVDIINDNYLVVTAATGLVGMNAKTGAIAWIIDGIYPVLGPGAGRYFPSLWIPEHNEILVRAQNLNGVNGNITAYDLNDGSQKPTIKWEYPYAEPVEMQAYGNGVVFIGSSTWSAFGLNATTGKLIWYQPIEEQLYFSGIYADGYFYTGGGDRFLYKFNSLTGEIVGTHDYGSFGFVAQGGAYGYGRYYTQFINYTGLYISAFDGNTLQELWSYAIPLYQGISQSYIQPAVADGKVWVYAYPGNRGAGVSARADLYCFDAFTGAVLYTIPFNTATPIVSYGKLYTYGNGYVTAFGNAPADWAHWRGPDGTGVAYNQSGPNELNERWRFRTGGAVTAPVIAAQGKVFVGSYDQNYYALNASTGALIWNFTTGYRIYSAPTYLNDVLYTGADDGYVYALNAKTGQVKWKTLITSKVHQVFGPGVQLRSSPIVDGGSLFVGSLDGNVYKLNIANGAVQWKVPTGGPIAGSPVVRNGNLFIGSTDRYIYSIRESDGFVNWKYLTPRGTNQSIGLEVGFCATPVVAQGLVFSGVNYDYKANTADGFVALNETTGARVYGIRQDNNVVGSYFNYNAPVYYNGMFFDADGNRGKVYNATNGAEISFTYVGHEPLSSYVMAENLGVRGNSVVKSPRLYFGTSLYVEYAYDASNASNLVKTGFYTAAAQVASTAAIYNNQLFIGSGDFNIYALGDDPAQATSIMAGTDQSSINQGQSISVIGALTGTKGETSTGAFWGGNGGIPNANITVSLRGPKGEAVDVPATTDNSGVFTISYTPTSAGNWNVLAWWNGYNFGTHGYQGTQGNSASFTVVAPATPTPPPTQTPSPSASATPTPTQSPTTSPSVVPTAPSGAVSSETVYIAIAAVVIIVVAAAAAVLLRRRK
jgi:outer membrane protein assembly factor BamB